jgi:multisubunit Na+/H+ antiporter MnhF subunit
LGVRVLQVSTGVHDDNVADDGLVVDYKGEAVDKSRTGGWLSAVLIACTYCCSIDCCRRRRCRGHVLAHDVFVLRCWLFSVRVFPGTELAERVAVIGVATNMVTYLVGTLHLSNAHSANIVTNFMGTLNLLAFIGGFAADAKLGRYRTIVGSATVTATVGQNSTRRFVRIALSDVACVHAPLLLHDGYDLSVGSL